MTANYYTPGFGDADVTLTAIIPGASGNNLIYAENGGLSWNLYGGADGTPATATLTLTSNLAAGSTVNIGNTTYTFTNGASSGTNVHIDTTAAGTLSNLAGVVNGNGSDISVHASASGNILTLTATAAGSAGNNLAATGNLTVVGGSAGTWSSNGGTLAGGVDASGPPPSDLNTPADAQAALVAVTTGINRVAQMRGSVGAYINQLQTASNVTATQTQTLTSAESGITSADIGKTVASLTNYNLLESTGMAALQQADQAQQSILKLLQ